MLCLPRSVLRVQCWSKVSHFSVTFPKSDAQLHYKLSTISKVYPLLQGIVLYICSMVYSASLYFSSTLFCLDVVPVVQSTVSDSTEIGGHLNAGKKPFFIKFVHNSYPGNTTTVKKRISNVSERLVFSLKCRGF